MERDIETGEEIPPQSLAYMRMIVKGYAPPVGQQGGVWLSMVRLQQEDPRRFAADWHKAEMEWEALCRSKSDAASDLGEDEGTEAALKLADDLLRSWGKQ